MTRLDAEIPSAIVAWKNNVLAQISHKKQIALYEITEATCKARDEIRKAKENQAPSNPKLPKKATKRSRKLARRTANETPFSACPSPAQDQRPRTTPFARAEAREGKHGLASLDTETPSGYPFPVRQRPPNSRYHSVPADTSGGGGQVQTHLRRGAQGVGDAGRLTLEEEDRHETARRMHSEGGQQRHLEEPLFPLMSLVEEISGA
jgi:hypothetical protein